MPKSKDHEKKLSPDSYDLAYTFCCITYSSVPLEAIFSINTQFLTAVISTKNKQLSAGRFFFECLMHFFFRMNSYYALFFFMSCTINKAPYNQYEVLPKNSRNLTIKNFLTVTPTFHVSSEVVPLGMYTAIPACFP